MNQFAAIKKQAVKAQDAEDKEKQEREKACYEEITAVLKKHNCELRPKLDYTPFGILPDAQIVALPKDEPKPTNDQPTTPDDQAGRVGEPLAPSKAIETAQAPAQA